MKIEATLDYPAILQGQDAFVHAALTLTANERPGGRARPGAFALVLDNSGSMEGRPLELAREAARMVVRHLQPEDHFGLVVFSDAARVVVPMRQIGDRTETDRRIAAIRSEGSTNLAGGWMLGLDELRRTPAELPRRVLLLSDGLLNVGITDTAQVAQLVAQGLEKDAARTSCLGFGDGYNEDLLGEMARISGGTLHDATSPESFPDIFCKELESLQRLSAQNVRVRLRKLHYCTGVLVLADYPITELPGGGIEIAVGDLVSREGRALVFGLEVMPMPPAPDLSLEGEDLVDMEIAWDEIGEGEVRARVERVTLRVKAVQDPAQVVLDESVLKWVAMQHAGAALRESLPHVDRGHFNGARERVEKALASLRRYGKPDRVAEGIALLEQFLDRMRCWDASSRKHVSTHAYRTSKPSSLHTCADLPERPYGKGSKPGGKSGPS
ncbi:MAG: VWA domain-containing protein [Verrucomicrobiae bacterium]|nr:VWA domain-containing protein [Verrucomicrobiae bacterium]